MAHSIISRATECLDLFNKCLTRDRLKLEANTERHRAAFILWASTIGAFADKSASADYRLEKHGDIKRTILGILEELVERLELLYGSANGNPLHPQVPDALHNERQDTRTASYSNTSPIKPDDSVSELYKLIEGLLDWLVRFAVAIRRAASHNRDIKSEQYSDPQDEGFEDFRGTTQDLLDLLWAQRLWDKTLTDVAEKTVTMLTEKTKKDLEMDKPRKDICQRIIEGNVRRRKRFLYMRSHDEHFRVKPVAEPLIKEKTTKAASPVPHLAPIKVQRPPPENDRPNIALTSNIESSAHTSIDPDKLELPHRPSPRKSAAIVADSAPAMKVKHHYPGIPKKCTGNGRFKCPYCCLPLELAWGSKLQKKEQEEIWKRHVKSDLRPYVCLLTTCTNPTESFISKTDWIRHMELEHQKIHTRWVCRSRHQVKQVFEREVKFVEHMRESHGGSFTEAMLPRLISRSALPAPHIFTRCPVCGDTFEEDNMSDASKETSRLLLSHIGEHLENVALSALPDVLFDSSIGSKSSVSSSGGSTSTRRDYLSDQSEIQYLQNEDSMPIEDSLVNETEAEDWAWAYHKLSLDLKSPKPFNCPYSKDKLFIDRPKLFRQLTNMLNYSNNESGIRPAPVLLIHGPPGAGKSQLAAKYAHRVHRGKKDVTVFWFFGNTIVDFQNSSLSPMDNRLLPKEKADGPEWVTRAHSWLQDEKKGAWLAVVDDACLCIDPSSDEEESFWQLIEKAIPICSHGTLLITSRKRPRDGFRNHRTLEVGEMTTEESHALVRAIFLPNDVEEQEVTALANIEERTPLALIEAVDRKHPGLPETCIMLSSLWSGINDTIPIGSNKDEAQACLSALFLTDPRDDRAKLTTAKGPRFESACQWIRGHAIYDSWLHSPSQLLWLHGGPGKGKTMLSIFLAEELEETAISQNKLFLQYFCDNKDERRNTAVAVLRGLIWQLLQLCPKLFDHILPDFKTQKTSLVSFEMLWRIFERMVCDPVLETTNCVLDGLDECDEASLEVLLRKFAALFSSITVEPSACHLNLLIVSRARPDFMPNLLSSFPRISLDLYDTSPEIERFIKVKVEKLSEDNHYSEALRVHVERVFRERAQGAFPWIGIVAKALNEIKATEVEKALDLFPPGLEELYAHMLLQIHSGQRDIAASLLRWVVMAVRPLTLLELSTIVSFSIVANRNERLRDQISYCGDFLVIKKYNPHGKDAKDEEDDEDEAYERDDPDSVRNFKVGLIHQSAKDYLLRKNKDPIPVLEDFRVKEDVANHEIAKRCLDYLESGALENSEPNVWSDEKHLGRFPLLSYAVLHWHEHARSLARSADVFDLSQPFWKNKSEIRTSWLKAYWQSEFTFYEPPESFTKLHLASFFGILSLVEKLVLREGWTNKIKRRHYLEKVDSQGMTALMWAVRHEHEAVVRLLLEKGANINVKTLESETVLMTVAAWGCEAVIHLLLDQGANIQSQDTFGQTALMYAAQSGHENIVKLLLDQGADIKVQDGRGGTALMRAAEKGRESVVHLLLQQGADINFQNSPSGKTALMMAADHGCEAIIQILLDQGADVEIQDMYGETALMKVAEGMLENKEAVIRLLLENGADIEAKNKNGETALMGAARRTRDTRAVIRLLLENGADVDAKDDNGETALMRVAGDGFAYREAIIRLLLENGADIEAKNKNGETALMKPAISGVKTPGVVVRLLLENGAEFNTENNDGETALAIAVRKREEAEDWTLMNSFLEYEPESEAKHRVEVRKLRLDSIIQALTLHSQTKSSI